jgi:Tfp pilus assembly pilus retraction ATPase PilT
MPLTKLQQFWIPADIGKRVPSRFRQDRLDQTVKLLIVLRLFPPKIQEIQSINFAQDITRAVTGQSFGLLSV